MNTEVFRFKSVKDLKELTADENENILIQVFCMEGIKELRKAGSILAEKFPNAVIVGVTAASAIESSKVVEKGIVVSLTYFEKSTLHVAYGEGNSDVVGKLIGCQLKEFANDDALLILLSDGTNTNGDSLLKELFSILPKVTVVGGMASVKNMNDPTAVLVRNQIIKKGAVGVLVTGDLKFETSYLFDWEEIGREHLITHSEGSRVFTIDGISAVDFYKNYLGKEIAEKLPETGIDYPLVFRRNGIKIARACIKKHEDGSLSFAGEIPTGQNVKIASGSLRGFSSKEKTITQLTSIAERNETVFIYSCISRKNFLGKMVKRELSIFKSVKNVGFFTHGEFFYTNNGSLLLNETLTLVGIREGKEKKPTKNKRKVNLYDKKDKDLSTLIPITNLLHRTSLECDLIIDSMSHTNIGFLVFKKMETNGKWYCSYASDNLHNIIGYSSRDIRIKIFSKEHVLNNLIYNRDREKVIKAIKEFSLKKKKSISIDYRIVLPTEKIRWIRSFIKVIEKDSDELMIHTFQDITPEKRIEYDKKKNYFLAVHDPLTGLFNRLYLFSRLPRILEVHKRKNKYGGILFIDLDGFKKINDSLGHNAGDKLLKEVAKRIKKSIRRGDIAVRFAGDEFVVILPLLSEDRKKALEFAKEVATKVLSQIISPFSLGSTQLSIGASIGVASFSGYSTEEKLLHKVDHLMYKAKSLGGKRLFSEDEE